LKNTGGRSNGLFGGRTRIVQVMIASDIQMGQIGGSAALFGNARRRRRAASAGHATTNKIERR